MNFIWSEHSIRCQIQNNMIVRYIKILRSNNKNKNHESVVSNEVYWCITQVDTEINNWMIASLSLMCDGGVNGEFQYICAIEKTVLKFWG